MSGLFRGRGGFPPPHSGRGRGSMVWVNKDVVLSEGNGARKHGPIAPQPSLYSSSRGPPKNMRWIREEHTEDPASVRPAAIAASSPIESILWGDKHSREAARPTIDRGGAAPPSRSMVWTRDVSDQGDQKANTPSVVDKPVPKLVPSASPPRVLSSVRQTSSSTGVSMKWFSPSLSGSGTLPSGSASPTKPSEGPVVRYSGAISSRRARPSSSATRVTGSNKWVNPSGITTARRPRGQPWWLAKSKSGSHNNSWSREGQAPDSTPRVTAKKTPWWLAKRVPKVDETRTFRWTNPDIAPTLPRPKKPSSNIARLSTSRHKNKSLVLKPSAGNSEAFPAPSRKRKAGNLTLDNSSKERRSRPTSVNLVLNNKPLAVSSAALSVRRNSSAIVTASAHVRAAEALLTRNKTLRRASAAAEKKAPGAGKSSSSGAKSSKKKKVTKYCIFYNKFGKCNEGDKCPYEHDPKRVSLCKQFLAAGTCEDPDCLLSHKLQAEKIPVCEFFLKGLCAKKDCTYSHVNVGPSAAPCPAFAEGYCPDGAACLLSHARVARTKKRKASSLVPGPSAQGTGPTAGKESTESSEKMLTGKSSEPGAARDEGEQQQPLAAKRPKNDGGVNRADGDGSQEQKMDVDDDDDDILPSFIRIAVRARTQQVQQH